jgi:hypothetical protein
MYKNLGKIDRAFRLLIGVAIVLFGTLNESSLGMIGIIPIISAFVGYSPLYMLFNINTAIQQEV